MPTASYPMRKAATSSSISVRTRRTKPPLQTNSSFVSSERTLGGLDVFLPYIRDYVATYIGKSITTEQWKSHLYGYYQQHNPEKIKALDSIDWNVGLNL